MATILSLPDSTLETVLAEVGADVAATSVGELAKLALLCKRLYEPAMRAALTNVYAAMPAGPAERSRQSALSELLDRRPTLGGAVRWIEIGLGDFGTASAIDNASEALFDALIGRMGSVRGVTIDIDAWMIGGCALQGSATLGILGGRGTISSLTLRAGQANLSHAAGSDDQSEEVMARIIAAFADSLRTLRVDHLGYLTQSSTPCGPLATLASSNASSCRTYSR